MRRLAPTNEELIKRYNGKRGSVASEMCRRARTIKFLLLYCTEDDRKFYSCMNDTISVLSKHPTNRY